MRLFSMRDQMATVDVAEIALVEWQRFAAGTHPPYVIVTLRSGIKVAEKFDDAVAGDRAAQDRYMEILAIWRSWE